jgi:hypothetical protein
MGFHTAWLQWVFEGKLLTLGQGVGGALCFAGLAIFVGGKLREADSPPLEDEAGSLQTQPLLEEPTQGKVQLGAPRHSDA